MKVTVKQLINALNVAIATRNNEDLKLVYEGVMIAIDQIDIFSISDEDAFALDEAADKALEKLAA